MNPYVTLDSDGECKGDSVYDDDDDNVDWVEPDPGSEDEVTAAPDLLFDSALLGAVGGVDGVARGVIRASVLDDMHENGWTVAKLVASFPYMDEPYEPRPEGWIQEDYHGIFGGDHGPTAGALIAASTALGTFLCLPTPRLVESWGEQRLLQRELECTSRSSTYEARSPPTKTTNIS
ncbi:uncharacterized protein IUM83_04101 [Phytophthora cinnamomi]|uniref:uncharacterized protein n=1 Tax=Phytophthora cinnamomi TaxID=4785 RepID=UPI0035596411|nr:hypothetical protein IUM83_04101 [Phytophthora cinnamomi]